MSELRDECYKCLNNQNCIPAADYGSFYCMTRRKFKMPENEDDSVYATKFAAMQKQIDDKDKRIKELEEENMEKDLEKIGIQQDTEANMKEIIEKYYTANEECIPKQREKEMQAKIKELEAKLEFKKYGDLDEIEFEEYMSHFIPKQKVKDYLKEEQERFEVYKKECETNENLKFGMWKHLGAKNMCEKILGIEKNIATLD